MRASTRGLALSAILLSALPAIASEREIQEHVERYFLEFNEGRPADRLAETFLSSPLTIVSSTGVTIKITDADVAGWLGEVQGTLAENGWLRSELLENRICIPAENIALFSMKFARVMNDNRTLHGITYILSKSDRWRISAILFMNPGKFLHCGDT